MNATIRAIILYVSLAIGTAILFWMVLARTMDHWDYLALARSGMLLLGLAATAWGILWQRTRLIWAGLGLLAAGLLTFAIEDWNWAWGSGCVWPTWASDWPLHDLFSRIGYGLWYPLTWGGLCLGHLGILGLVVLNGMLIHRGASAREFIGANLLVVAGIAAFAAML